MLTLQENRSDAWATMGSEQPAFFYGVAANGTAPIMPLHNKPVPHPSDTVMISAAVAIPSSLCPEAPATEPARAIAERSCDARWVARIMDEDGKGILGVLWRLLGHEHDVMDAFQECFCKLAAKGRPRDMKAARAYAYRTASNIAIEMIRSRKRRGAHWGAIVAHRQASDSMTPDTGDFVEGHAGDHEQLRLAIAALPPHLRQVVVLRDLARMSYDDVGRILKIDPATARVYRRHAMIRLADSATEELA